MKRLHQRAQTLKSMNWLELAISTLFMLMHFKKRSHFPILNVNFGAKFPLQADTDTLYAGDG